ncbi:hypothetical protein A4X09_0g488 [Tilletia walkeri]|uniref:Uncharacterized protein n=1 Tax=Tilletia walkeri TaxID=117179 RepID=A0A8X7NH83_9BASI|nr:hypothetical protein A4X09_0g488 [Tilletia walkeri]
MLIPSFKAILASIVLAGAAVAQTEGPYSLGLAPVDIEKSVLNTTLSCNVTAIGFFNLGSQSIGFGVAANLPNRASLNQPFYITAGARLIVPKSLSILAGRFGARYYGGTVDSVTLNTAGATTASVEAAKGIAIPAAPLNQNGVSVLEVPGTGQSLMVGPIKASKAGEILLSFGQITSTIKTLDQNKNPTLITAKVVCPAQARPVSLAAVTVGGKASTAAIYPPYLFAYPTIPADKAVVLTGFNYDCDFEFFAGAIRVSFGVVKPANTQVKSGQPIVLSQGQANLILSDDLVGTITDLTATDNVVVTFNTFNLIASNATPAKQNIIPAGGIEYKNFIFQKGSSFNPDGGSFSIPPTAPRTPFSDIKFTAGTSGSTALISVGDASGTIEFPDFDVKFTCKAPSPAPAILAFDIQ